ncbi:MAG TPA: HAD-IA family hydrolase [Blastocatellia bacterium]|nr:HAD-IA family hydrolase [Blastocatellia bacterium]
MKNSESYLKNTKAIFFDAGGTLIHLDSVRICRLISDELGVETFSDKFPRAQSLAMSRVAELVAEGAGSTESLKDQFYLTLLPEIGVPEDKLTHAIEHVLALARAEMLWRKAEPQTASTLEELKERGLRLAVVSNSDGRIRHAFEQAGLDAYFDFFIDSFLIGVEKPDPRIFQLATEQAGVDTGEAAYVGDLYHVDVVGARAAGLLPVLYDPFQLYPDADCLTIRAISDLLTLI